MGERQGEADAARLDLPQRAARCHSSSARRTSRRGCEAIARWTSRSPARLAARRSRARTICGHGRTRSAKAGVEHGDAAGDERRASRGSTRAGRRRAGPRVEQVARAHELGGRPIADLDVDREHSFEQKQARAAGAGRRPAERDAVADPDLEHDDGRHLAATMRIRMSNSCGEVGIGVEQVAVRGAAGRRRSRSTCCSGPGETIDARGPSSHRLQASSRPAVWSCAMCLATRGNPDYPRGGNREYGDGHAPLGRWWNRRRAKSDRRNAGHVLGNSGAGHRVRRRGQPAGQGRRRGRRRNVNVGLLDGEETAAHSPATGC